MIVGHDEDVRLRESGKILHDLSELTIVAVMLLVGVSASLIRIHDFAWLAMPYSVLRSPLTVP
jgi:hypothetical protein